MNKSLSVRNKMKSKKPNFTRTDTNRKKQFKNTWRKPKGIHNKIRRHRRGLNTMPSVGYSSPRNVKGLTRDGLVQVLIKNTNDIKLIDKKVSIAIISNSVGRRKKVELIKILEEENIKIGNIKDSKGFITKSEDRLKERKKESISRKEKREKLKEESPKKKEEKQKEEKENEFKK